MPFLNTIFDTIFPANCLSCGASGVDLCTQCLEESPVAERETAKWVFPLYDYRHPPVKKALWLLKYKGKKKLARVFAEALYNSMLEELSELRIMENFRDPLLIPIPLSRKRHRERGYNQAELICRELKKLFNETWPIMLNDVLVKPKDTAHQARIENRKERMENIVGSFSVQNPEAVQGRNIILIDDIVTTGATLSEARKILKQSGARKVIAFTVAH